MADVVRIAGQPSGQDEQLRAVLPGCEVTKLLVTSGKLTVTVQTSLADTDTSDALRTLADAHTERVLRVTFEAHS